MKLSAAISNTPHQIDLDLAQDSVTAVVDGRDYTLNVSQPEPGLYVLRDGSKTTVAFVSKLADGTSQVTIKNHTVDVMLTDPKRLRGKSAGDDQASGRAEIKTAMPGKVVRILVAQGNAVQKGDGIIVVEAMKMQNEMKSPKDGSVDEIRVSEGETVGAGDVLIVIN